jgi:predicted peroxiredoxin
MAQYLLIETRDPFESKDVDTYYELASGLARDGNQVTLFLVQNGVLPARPSTGSKALADLGRAGVQVLADEFSLRERGIAAERLAAGIRAAGLDTVITHLEQGAKALWH